MSGRFAFDTNILAYAEGIQKLPDDAIKSRKASLLVAHLDQANAEMAAPVQVMAELHDVLVRKGRHSRLEAGLRIDRWCRTLSILPTSLEILKAATTLSAEHQFRIYDGIILAAAAEYRCDQLLSEDMQHGFVWRGVEVVNPFVEG